MRITQGCQRAELTEDIWKLKETPRDETCWRNNLACLTILKTRELSINIRTKSNLWLMFECSTRIQELLEACLWIKSGTKISEADLIHLH